MQDSAKYLIHANITADGVVERSDVVGAVFGQTEGLLGSDLDLRDLQQSQKVGRIDVEINSENGQSVGEITIASGLDKVETAILAAALETIDRVGPCRSTVEIQKLEDVRAAKRREVIERAKGLLDEFEGETVTSQEIIEEVRRAVRVEDITEYEGLPAGPRVSNSDAIIVVEGRADVLQLLQFGIKNAIAVEGTDVPDAVANLTKTRTVTAFLDGDRGGDLILKELKQVGSIDYVAFAPSGMSVEDLPRNEVMTALREKVPFDMISDANSPHETVAATDGSSRPAPPDITDKHSDPPPDVTDGPIDPATDQRTVAETDAEAKAKAEAEAEAETETETETETEAEAEAMASDTASHTDSSASTDTETTDEASEATATDSDPETLTEHVLAVIEAETGTVRLLSSEFETVATAPAEEAFETVADAETAPATVVLDGKLTQRILDVAAQRGVEQIVTRTEGEYVKKPTGVRVRTIDEFEIEA